MPTWIPIAAALAVPRQKTRQDRRWPGGKRKESARTIMIYALVDPRDQCIRYIGVTTRTTGERLKLHLEKPTNAGMRAWFADLAQAGKRPEMVKLEWVTRGEWEDAERGWIQWCRERGALLNVDRGGKARAADGRLRGFTAGAYQEPVGGPREAIDRAVAEFSQDGPKRPGGGSTDQGPSPECRPRLVPVTAGVFRRAR